MNNKLILNTEQTQLNENKVIDIPIIKTKPSVGFKLYNSQKS